MATDHPLSLTDEAYLLPYDLRRRRHRNFFRAGLVQAAALFELVAAGLIDDGGDRPRAGDGQAGDPVLDGLLVRARTWPTDLSWSDWIGQEAPRTREAVEADLARRGVIRVTHGRLLGVWPLTRVSVPDPAVVDALVRRVRTAAFGDVPVDEVPDRDVVLTAFASAIQLNTVLGVAGHLRQGRRMARLRERAGPMADHLDQNSRFDNWPPVY